MRFREDLVFYRMEIRTNTTYGAADKEKRWKRHQYIRITVFL